MNEIRIPETNEELLSECEVDTFRSSGRGGQNVNRRETAVRLRHKPSGTTVVSQKERSQYLNKQIALEQLRDKLKKKTRRRKKRIPTRMSGATRRRILNDKRRRAKKKELRKKPSLND